MASRQQQMDGDMKELRGLINSLRGDLKTARSAQVSRWHPVAAVC